MKRAPGRPGQVGAVLRDLVSDALARLRAAGRATASSARSRRTCASSSARRASSARAIFHAMVRFGPKLERRQMVLFRAVDIGAELFAMAAACVRAQHAREEQGQQEAIDARRRVLPRGAAPHRAALPTSSSARTTTALYKVAQQVLKGEHAWLEQGIVGMHAGIEGSRGRGSGVRSQGSAERRGEKAAALINEPTGSRFARPRLFPPLTPDP